MASAVQFRLSGLSRGQCAVCCVRQFALTVVPISTHEYKWVPAK